MELIRTILGVGVSIGIGCAVTALALKIFAALEDAGDEIKVPIGALLLACIIVVWALIINTWKAGFR